MSGWGFNIKLWPEWKEVVKASGIDQKQADTAISNLGNTWLDACGYGRLFDPDNYGFEKDPKKKPGPRSHRLYDANMGVILVQWGEWGLEHITVPGNACGLDIDRSAVGAPRDGACLYPHNVDNIYQAYLLQLVFNWFANAMVLERECREHKMLV
jgi:hypothetical protein